MMTPKPRIGRMASRPAPPPPPPPLNTVKKRRGRQPMKHLADRIELKAPEPQPQPQAQAPVVVPAPPPTTATVKTVSDCSDSEDFEVEQNTDPATWDSTRRKHAKKRLIKFMTNYTENLSNDDKRDYSEFYDAIIKAVEKFENEVKNPTILADFFITILPYTATVIGLQVINEFIQCFPKASQSQMYSKLRIFKPYAISYNCLEEAEQYGKQNSFRVYFDIPEGKVSKSFKIYPSAYYTDFTHILTTIAMVEPERVPFGEKVVIHAYVLGKTPNKLCQFTHYSVQFLSLIHI